MGGAACVVLVPVLRRPHRVAPLLASLAASQADARALFIASPGDEAEQVAVTDAGGDLLTIEAEVAPGDYARKINAGYRATGEPLMLLGADDITFRPGWLEAVIAQLRPGVGVIGTNDLGSSRVMAGHHATHPVVTRVYADDHGTIDRPGEVLHEGYGHNFVDDELVGTAKRRGAWAFASDAIVEHHHPDWGKAPRDEVYDLGRARWAQDRLHFKQRLHLWK